MNSSSSSFWSRKRRVVSAAASAAAAVVLAAGGFAIPAAALAGRPDPRDCDDCGDRPRVALASARERQVQLTADDNDSRRGRDKHDGDKHDGDKREGDRRDDGDKDKDKGDDGRRSYGGPFDMSWGYGKGGPGDQRSPRPNEWAEVRHFMNRYSPRRQFALDELPEGEKKESIKKFVFARYRSLQSLQRRDQTGYDQRLAQLVIEDEIFGVVSGWGAAGKEERGKLKQALRDKVARLVDIDLQERKRRVEWLKRELAQQTRELEQDQGERDDLVERRATRFAEWAERSAAVRAKQEGEKGAPGAPPCPQGQGPTQNPNAGPAETPAPPAGQQKSQ